MSDEIPVVEDHEHPYPDGSPRLVRMMTAAQIHERMQLNIENTAGRIAARAAAGRAAQNGHGPAR